MRGLLLLDWKRIYRRLSWQFAFFGVYFGLMNMGPGFTLSMSLAMPAGLLGLFGSLAVKQEGADFGALPVPRFLWALRPWLWAGLGLVAGLVVSAPLGLLIQYLAYGRDVLKELEPLTLLGGVQAALIMTLMIPGVQRWGYPGLLLGLLPLGVLFLPVVALEGQLTIPIMVAMVVISLAIPLGAFLWSLQMGRSKEFGGGA